MDWRRMFALTGLIYAGCTLGAASGPGPVKVEIIKTGSGYQLLRAGKTYVIKGAGLGDGDFVSFAAHGGNSIRNWGTENAGAVLDAAFANGVTVALCLGMQPERAGFDYDDPQAIATQLGNMRKEVMKYRDHPALLAWIIGNELNWDYSNSKVYDAVNDVSKMIHELDPNHPTTTTVSGLGKNVLVDLTSRAPDLDFVSFQVYKALADLPEFLRETGYKKPFWITEWGTIGHWEVPKTAWGAPIEMTSSEKAGLYLRGQQAFIQPLGGQVIGTYAFFWGQKQERTPTWYGMFTESGEETETVDVMHWLWNGQWPANRSPVVHSLRLDGRTADQDVELRPGETYSASVDVFDHDGDTLHYHWEVKPESEAQQAAGDFESSIANLEVALGDRHATKTTITAPAKAGAYRLFVYAYDGNNHAAHANIPFLVTGD